MGNRYWVIPVVILVFACAACAGGGADSGQALLTDPPNETPDGLQGPRAILEDLGPRTASLVFDREGDSLAPDCSQGVTLVEGTVRFAPHWDPELAEGDQLAYAVYRFSTTEITQHQMQLDWAEAPADPADLWIGLANWGAECWDWYAANAEGGIDLDTGSYDDYAHPDTHEVLVALVLTGTAQTALSGISIAADQRGSWPTYQHDPQRTGRSEYVGPQSADLQWTFRTTGDGMTIGDVKQAPDGTLYACSEYELLSLSPDGTVLWRSGDLFRKSVRYLIASDGTVYVGSSGSGVYALNPDHTFRWHYPVYCSTQPVLGPDGAIYLGTYDGIVALNTDGTERWSMLSGGQVYAEPAFGTDGTVYYACADGDSYPGSGHLYSVSADGTEQWSVELYDCISDGPRISAVGDIFVESDRQLIAYDPDGNELWRYSTGDFFSYFTNSDYQITDTLYIGTEDNVLALNLDGSLKWLCELDTQVSTRLEIGPDGTIYAGAGQSGYDADGEESVYAISPEGEVQWRYRTDSYLHTVDLIIADNMLFAGAYEDKLHALDLEGNLAWTLSAGGPIYSSPVTAADGTIYFGCDDNRLYAVNPDGTLKWYFETDHIVRSTPAVGYDGTVFFGCHDDHVYAVTPDGELSWSYETGAAVIEPPAIAADGSVYVSCSGGILYVFDYSGGLLWSLQEGFGNLTAPAIAADGRLYISDYENGLSKISPDGQVIWSNHYNNFPPAMPMIGGTGDIFISDGYTHRVSTEGIELWSTDIANDVGGVFSLTEAGADRLVTVGSNAEFGLLYSFDLAGGLLWTVEMSSGLFSAAVADASGNTYVGCGWQIVSVNPAGEQPWSYESSGYYQTAPAIGADGTLYIGSTNGKLYAFGPGPGE